ncbi:MAG: glutamate--tRNA ligase [Deltaproteobacteria bacterium]|nr:glutamate--tRNA ligase [Deltaproteobacteria bacterium]
MVRVRFAPSPTGYLHIGGVRTALFNWLWARKTGGSFVLRIEDTDRERSTPENEQVILRDLAWLGLRWDEGPERGGAHGPYRQTERLEIYRRFADELIARRAAYRCYCTREDLDRARAELKRRDPKAEFRYPGTCRDRPDAPDRPYVVRLRAPSAGEVVYRDLVFGEIRTPNSAQQDVVLLRSDGVPLYNFGCVVDDLTMGITLVARGRDHMINTPLQVLLYAALDREPPQLAHLPMMLARDGQKLSKRHGAVSVGEYRQAGILPGALLNYLARFGWSCGDEELFSLEELTRKFDWSGCGKADGKFDPTKLAAIGFEHLMRPELCSDEEYAERLLPYLAERGLEAVERALVRRSLAAIRQRARNLREAADWLDFLFREPPAMDEKAKSKFLLSGRAEHLPAFHELVQGLDDFSEPALEAAVTGWLARSGLEIKDVAQAARVALTGRSVSPGLYQVMALLGKERTLARLAHGLKLAGA